MDNPFNPNRKNLPEVIIVRAKPALSTELDGETVILNTETGMYSGLDEVGTSIWQILEAKASIAELISQICAEYDVSEKQCCIDICAFLKDLFDNNLVEIIDDGSSKVL